jgi:hypothetical protein
MMKLHRQIDEDTARKITERRIGKRLARLGAKRLDGKHRVKSAEAPPDPVWSLARHEFYAKIKAAEDLRQEFYAQIKAAEKLREEFEEDCKRAAETEQKIGTTAKIVELNRRRVVGGGKPS